MNRHGILLVQYGTLNETARTSSLDQLYLELKARRPRTPVAQAYINEDMLSRIPQEERYTPVGTISEAMAQLKAEGVNDLLVLNSFVSPGISFMEMSGALQKNAHGFIHIRVLPAMIADSSSRQYGGLIRILKAFEAEYADAEILLVGHGFDEQAALFYRMFEYQMAHKHITHTHVVLMHGPDSLETVIPELQKNSAGRPVLLVPFMMTAGMHAVHELNEIDGKMTLKLRAAGFEVHTIMHGLGEDPAYRKLLLSMI